MKLAKQLAAVKFLREAVGTRTKLNLEALVTETGGGAAANAALAAAVRRDGKGKAAGAEAAAAGGEKKPTAKDVAEVAKMALDDGGWWLASLT